MKNIIYIFYFIFLRAVKKYKDLNKPALNGGIYSIYRDNYAKIVFHLNMPRTPLTEDI